MINKLKVQQRFDLASHTYDKVATIQNICAKQLVYSLADKWPDFKPDTILDVGTGTGYLPELLFPAYPDSHFTLNDLSPNMLLRAQERIREFANIHCLPGDIETTPIPRHDLVVSNFALQWVNQLEPILQSLYENSKVLAFTCLLQGTFQEWERRLYNQTPQHQTYPQEKSLINFLTSLKPKDYLFYHQKHTIQIQNALELMRYLKQLGASTSQLQPSPGQLKTLIQTHSHPFEVTYHVFFGLLKRI